MSGLSVAELDALIAQATVDCYDDDCYDEHEQGGRPRRRLIESGADLGRETTRKSWGNTVSEGLEHVFVARLPRAGVHVENGSSPDGVRARRRRAVIRRWP